MANSPEKMDWIWPIVQSLGGVAVVVASAGGVAYAMFRLLAEKWLDTKFGERLEALRHAQQRELEQLRARISALMDRSTKLHQREYDTLPILWEKLISAQAAIASLISPMQSVADVGRMNDAQLEEFLTAGELLGTQRDAVRSSERNQRTRVYQREIYWHRKAKVSETAREFSRYLKFNGIFVQPEVKAKSARLEKLLWDALTEHQLNEEEDIKPRLREASKLLDQEGPQLIADIEMLIQARLWTVTDLT